jgi:hypothetical protein
MNGRWLFETSGFVTLGHWAAGWAPWLRQTWLLANFLIGYCAFVIALNLFRLYRSKKSELPAPELLVLSSALLVLGGLSHLGDVVVFFWAPYRLLTTIDVATAVCAAAVACRLPSVVQRMVRLPTLEHIRSVNRALEDDLSRSARSNHELIQRNAALKERVRALEHMIKTNIWISEKTAMMEEFSRIHSKGELT